MKPIQEFIQFCPRPLPRRPCSHQPAHNPHKQLDTGQPAGLVQYQQQQCQLLQHTVQQKRQQLYRSKKSAGREAVSRGQRAISQCIPLCVSHYTHRQLLPYSRHTTRWQQGIFGNSVLPRQQERSKPVPQSGTRCTNGNRLSRKQAHNHTACKPERAYHQRGKNTHKHFYQKHTNPPKRCVLYPHTYSRQHADTAVCKGVSVRESVQKENIF